MTNFDDMRLAVEALTGGKNTVILDDLGYPSVMVLVPQMLSSEIISGATETVHPAFVLDGVTKASVAISKYQNIVVSNRAYSLPMQDPKTSINFDAARTSCKNKGEGWGLQPFSLWSAIALWCKMNGTMPHGNNNYGRDAAYTYEKGIEVSKDGTKTARTATGSGPATWYHDHTQAGIADMNGNVWEWCDGMRLYDGEIQIIPYANSMLATTDVSATSTEWKAIKSDGTLVTPGTTGTLKYDYVSSKITLSTSITTSADSGRSQTFQTLALASGLTAPQIIKELALYPADTDGYEGDSFFMNNTGERLPVRGGSWISGSKAGVFASNLNYPRSLSDGPFGFRSAYYGEL